MKVKIISGSLSEIDRILDGYGHEHYINENNLLVVDKDGIECLERILGIRYEFIEGKSVTSQDIYRHIMTK